MEGLRQQIEKFPRNPGVYKFIDNRGKILYLGKATSLKDRVGSYLTGKDSRGQRILRMVSKAVSVKCIQTDTVLEALILEANLIKKYQPKYNIEGKDDRSFAYFIITEEVFPRVLIWRERDIPLQKKRQPVSDIFGPYQNKKQMESALKIIRSIFPFHRLKQKSEKGCLDYQIGFCSGPYAGKITPKEYAKNIRGIKMLLSGKKKCLIKKMEQDMKQAAGRLNYEKAGDLRDKLFALQHIRDMALVSKEIIAPNLKNIKKFRVEAYDISNIFGQFCVGSMVVAVDGQICKSEYRKFKIRMAPKGDDLAAMAEVLSRRFKNNWSLPDLIILDGGKAHLTMGTKVVQAQGLNISLVAVSKGPRRKGVCRHGLAAIKDGSARNFLNDEMAVRWIRDEAHRFAIKYHRLIRKKAFGV